MSAFGRVVVGCHGALLGAAFLLGFESTALAEPPASAASSARTPVPPAVGSAQAAAPTTGSPPSAPTPAPPARTASPAAGSAEATASATGSPPSAPTAATPAQAVAPASAAIASAQGYRPPAGYPPPGYPLPAQYPGYPPSAYAHPTSPRTLPYQEGQPIPPGYRVETGMRKGLVISGSIVLGVPWVLGWTIASVSNYSNASGWLIVPGVGPWLTLATRKSCCSQDGVRGMLMFDGLMQTAGASLLIVGLAVPSTRLVRFDLASVELMPLAAPGQAGLVALGTFF